MKVVHVVAKDYGGAGKAALRINSALNSIGIDSKVLVLEKRSSDSSVTSVFRNRTSFYFFKAIRKCRMHMHLNSLAKDFYVPRYGLNLSKISIVQEADIINLHWINDHMANLDTIKSIENIGKPIVWTLHDMYPFTAGCYYDHECGQYSDGCKKCILSNDDKIRKEIASLYDIKLKSDIFKQIYYVGCSNWIANCAKKSPLTNPDRVTAIHNPIDLDIFKPVKTNRMPYYGKKVVLFGAMLSDQDPRKGMDLLKKALQLIDGTKYIAVIFGNEGQYNGSVGTVEIHGIGKINSDEKLSELYSSADVFVAPSRQENLSNAVVESLACGTPVVAFNIGGMPDLIEHKKNGFLAKPYDPSSLKEGIEWGANNKAYASQFCITKIKKEFSNKQIASQYHDLYVKAISKANKDD